MGRILPEQFRQSPTVKRFVSELFTKKLSARRPTRSYSDLLRAKSRNAKAERVSTLKQLELG